MYLMKEIIRYRQEYGTNKQGQQSPDKGSMVGSFKESIPDVWLTLSFDVT